LKGNLKRNRKRRKGKNKLLPTSYMHGTDLHA